MKKVILAIGAGIFPYWLIAGCLLANARRSGDVGSPLISSLIVWLIGLCCAIAFLALSGREVWEARKAAALALALKLVQIPFYVLFFLLGASGAVMIQFVAITLFAWLIDVMTIILSGLVGLSAVLRCRAEGKLTRTRAVVHGILQFVFCADVISAIIVYRNARRIPQ